jgi:menaquinone-9 beta-reductase
MSGALPSYDVLICGAGLAGTACALTLAEQGLRVGVVEKFQNEDGYKVLCSHYFQPASLPLFHRLGL